MPGTKSTIGRMYQLLFCLTDSPPPPPPQIKKKKKAKGEGESMCLLVCVCVHVVDRTGSRVVASRALVVV